MYGRNIVYNVKDGEGCNGGPYLWHIHTSVCSNNICVHLERIKHTVVFRLLYFKCAICIKSTLIY